MMKWGKKKPSSSSTSSSSSSIFPMSWFSKLMQKDSNLEHKPGKLSPKPNPQPKTATQSTPPGPVSCLKNGRFHSPGDDAYSSLPFVEDSLGAHRTTGNSQSKDCNRDIVKFNDMVSGIRKMKELPRSVEVSPEVVKDVAVEGEQGREELIVPGRKAAKDRQLRKTCRRVLEEKMQELARIPEETPEEKDIFEARVPDTRNKSNPYGLNSGNGNSTTIEEDYVLRDLNFNERFNLSEEKVTSEWKQLKDMKIREVLSKGEKQRKSIYISREQHRRPKQSCKVKAYSPRTAARIECKIKALEDMKKARMMKKMKQIEKRTLFDSYAVAKSSFDPERDFRSSMIEMITEKGIKRPEELEELLACYLTLNADEYHELIIKVFRQVWFELNNECFGPEKQM